MLPGIRIAILRLRKETCKSGTMSIDRAAMRRDRTNIVAWGTVMSAVMLASVAFPKIAESANNQRVEAQTQADFEALKDFAKSDDHISISYWLDSEKDVIATITSTTSFVVDKNIDLASEIECMAEAVYYEARSETASGQRAVAEVILNRVKNKHFPDSVCGVVYQGSERSTGCQFTFTCDGSMEIAPKGKVWDRSVKVANLVMSSGYTPSTHWATHYHTTEVSPKWSKTMRMTRQVGNHVFYRFAPRNYVPSEPALLVAPPI